MPRAQKAKKPVESPRLPSDFEKAELERVLRTHARVNGLGWWTEESILAAREAQAQGRFRTPVALGRAIFSEPSIAKAALNRLAPGRGLGRQIRCSTKLFGTAQAVLDEAIATFAVGTTALPSAVLAIIFLQVAIHEISIAQIQWETRADESREDAFLTNFPLECVEWDDHEQKLYALTDEGRVEIVHGDGRWIVFTKLAEKPWAYASLIALAMLWCAQAFGRKHWDRNVKSHGDDKWVGELPEGVPTDSGDGVAMLIELLKMYEPQRAMLVPHGGKVERKEAVGQNWQTFKEKIEGGSKDAAGLFVGQDGTVVNSGGNYVKSWLLYGVRNDIVESDLTCVGEAISTGLLRPWSIRNFKRWDRLEYYWQLPDADDDARRESIAKRWDDFNRIVKATRETGAVVDQKFVNELAEQLGLESPRLADSTPSGADFFAYEIEGGIVTIDEVRARKGLEPLPDGKGRLTVPEARAAAEAAKSDGVASAASGTYPHPAAA